MHPSRAMAGAPERRLDRVAGVADRLLRLAADPRVAVALLLLAAFANALAAALPGGAWLLETPAYLALVAAVVLSGIAGVGVRAPAAWREWRHPAPLPPAADLLRAELHLPEGPDAALRERLVAELRAAGYRAVIAQSAGRWRAAGVRHGWSRFAGLGTHLAVVLLVLGAALGGALGSETRFSLLPGEQALLDTPRSGFTDSLRLDRFDAEIGADGRPRRLDAHVTFLRDGRPAGSQLVQVNRPGEFGGHLVHGWTYGPAARLRVASLGGAPLHDGALALDTIVDGRPSGLVQMPARGLSLAVSLADAGANELLIRVVDASGAVDAARLRPGQAARLGDVRAMHLGLDAYVTFLSRRDPGQGVVFAGAGMLVVGLAASLWFPRRRVTLHAGERSVVVLLRGGRFDRPAAEQRRLLERLRRRLEGEP